VCPASILSLPIQTGQTPLIIASFGGYHHMAREFIAAGANIDHQGADTNLVDVTQSTPANLAEIYGCNSVVTYLRGLEENGST